MNDNIYVFEKSIHAAEKGLESISRSLENERKKAGILLGFYFLMMIEGLNYFETLPMFLKGVCFVLILFALVLLILSFCSTKVKNEVDVKENFKVDWKDRKEEFLKFYYQIVLENMEDQKRVLTQNSKRIKWSSILLGAIIIILFLHLNLPMFNQFFEDTKDTKSSSQQSDRRDIRNPMSSGRHEESVARGNPMKPGISEKSA